MHKIVYLTIQFILKAYKLYLSPNKLWGVLVFWTYFLVLIEHSPSCYFFLIFSGVFELNFMASQPASGYYQFTIAVTGDSRLVANRVEVRWQWVSHASLLTWLNWMHTVILWMWWSCCCWVQGGRLWLQTVLGCLSLFSVLFLMCCHAW